MTRRRARSSRRSRRGDVAAHGLKLTAPQWKALEEAAGVEEPHAAHISFDGLPPGSVNVRVLRKLTALGLLVERQKFGGYTMRGMATTTTWHITPAGTAALAARRRASR